MIVMEITTPTGSMRLERFPHLKKVFDIIKPDKVQHTGDIVVVQTSISAIIQFPKALTDKAAIPEEWAPWAEQVRKAIVPATLGRLINEFGEKLMTAQMKGYVERYYIEHGESDDLRAWVNRLELILKGA